MKKLGVEMPSRANTRAKRSSAVPRLTALSTPRGTPSPIAIAIDISPSCRVTGPPRQDLIDDGTAVDEGVAEVTLQEDAPQPPDVLLEQRAVEAELGEDEGAGLGVVGDGDPHHPGDDVARDDADEQEGEEGHPQHHRDQQEQAPYDVPTHADRISSGIRRPVAAPADPATAETSLVPVPTCPARDSAGAGRYRSASPCSS